MTDDGRFGAPRAFCGYGDSVEIPKGFSVGMGWVRKLKFNPHGSPSDCSPNGATAMRPLLYYCAHLSVFTRDHSAAAKLTAKKVTDFHMQLFCAFFSLFAFRFLK